MDNKLILPESTTNREDFKSPEINPWVYQEAWKLSIRLHILAGKQLPDRPAGIDPERWFELVHLAREDAAETQVNLLASPYKNLQELQDAYAAELPFHLEKIEPVLRVLR
jgi:hypothetical protein